MCLRRRICTEIGQFKTEDDQIKRQSSEVTPFVGPRNRWFYSASATHSANCLLSSFGSSELAVVWTLF